MKELIKQQDSQNLEDVLQSLRRKKNQIDAEIATCEQSILNQHRIEIQDSLKDKDEPYGDVTIGNIKFKVPKYIKWDEKKLIDIQNQILEEGGNPHDWIKYELSVAEATFKALPKELKEVFSEARKVTSGKINISFKE